MKMKSRIPKSINRLLFLCFAEDTLMASKTAEGLDNQDNTKCTGEYAPEAGINNIIGGSGY